MALPTLIFVVLILTIGIFMLMRLCERRDKKLIPKLYVFLAVIYFIVGPRLIHFFMELLVFDDTNLATAFVEMMLYCALYVSIVLSALLGILMYLKDRAILIEFAKSFAWLLVMFPIGLMIWT